MDGLRVHGWYCVASRLVIVNALQHVIDGPGGIGVARQLGMHLRDMDERVPGEHAGEGGLLFRQGSPPHATYLFKHALVQDAAYGTLLRGPRQELHARIAAATETGMPERVEREPEPRPGSHFCDHMKWRISN